MQKGSGHSHRSPSSPRLVLVTFAIAPRSITQELSDESHLHLLLFRKSEWQSEDSNSATIVTNPQEATLLGVEGQARCPLRPSAGQRQLKHRLLSALQEIVDVDASHLHGNRKDARPCGGPRSCGNRARRKTLRRWKKRLDGPLLKNVKELDRAVNGAGQHELPMEWRKRCHSDGTSMRLQVCRLGCWKKDKRIWLGLEDHLSTDFLETSCPAISFHVMLKL
mmetsp:Transcript_31560/g.68004  ORF Transcript_31560/g.68004 Transcript_31560/m.68004 type:complete len:222 (+) Transcript_31560:45-710(+)